MDETNILRRLLQEAEQRREAAEQGREAAEQRIEAEKQGREAAEQRMEAEKQGREAAEQRAEAAERSAAEARQASENTSLPKFLELCHNHLSLPLRVETNLFLTTLGSITRPNGRKHPTYLRPWEDFPQLHQHYFDQAYAILCPNDAPPKLFPPRITIENIGESVCHRSLSCEDSVRVYECSAVQDMVQKVMAQLTKIPEAQELLGGGGEFEFDHHLHPLSDKAEEVVQRQMDAMEPDYHQRKSPIDQACVFRTAKGDRRLLYVREYKAAHKLTVEYLRAGLRPMDVREDVIQRVIIPTDPQEKLTYNADRLVAAAVTQTFEYMIENGLEYGNVSTGLAGVYLRILKNDPETVYYYLTEPQLDVEAREENETGFRYPLTAVGRLLGFSLMALSSPRRDQKWRDWASNKLGRWEVDFTQVLNSIPFSERRQSPPGSAYKPPRYLGSPTERRMTRRRLVEDVEKLSIRSNTPSDDDDDDTAVDTPTKEKKKKTTTTTTTKKTKNEKNKSNGKTTGEMTKMNNKTKTMALLKPGKNDSRMWEYCTQNCLLGLKRGGCLDPGCPNVDRHRLGQDAWFHQLDLASFHQHVQDQLKADMDHDIKPLDKHGARGVLFKITLKSHGYTFVGKGTVAAFVEDLRREGQVYRRLKKMQGSAVPVCLGNMDLERTYYLLGGVRIVHMLFMAWGGPSLRECTPLMAQGLLEREKARSLDEISAWQVIHNDSRPANMLWNEEASRVMIIDFERSVMRSNKRQMDVNGVLKEMSDNANRLVRREKGADF